MNLGETELAHLRNRIDFPRGTFYPLRSLLVYVKHGAHLRYEHSALVPHMKFAPHSSLFATSSLKPLHLEVYSSFGV